MGRMRSRWRQHLHFSAACLILFMVVTACAPLTQTFAEREGCCHLTRLNSFISRGDFEGAMKQCQDVLARSPKTPPGDEALMDMGLISAHYANPKKDYRKALGYFTRVDKEFPQSPLVEEAKIWTSVLQAFEKAKQVDFEIEEKKQGLGK
ncbi:MAG TPA: hypothetical protein VEM40_01400 [Nitrospirota bacterium]|nr:hypothetical protein [Nitrospirota bacterium]